MLWSNQPSPISHHSLPPTSSKTYFMLSTEVCSIQVFISPWHTHHLMVSPLKNSCWIFTPPCSTLALASNIYTLFTSSSSPQVLFFSITYHYHLRHNSPHMHAIFFFHIWYSNAITTFETNPYPWQYHFQVHFATSPQQQHISIAVRFL